MPATPEPEVLRPRVARGADLFSDRNLDLLSHLLDDFLRIPGTQIRFGLDGIVGLIPGVGDVLGAMASWIIVIAAWLRGVPRITLARMLANIAIETIVGTIPVLGDAFDIAWKANRRNFVLLERSTGTVPGYADGAYPPGAYTAASTEVLPPNAASSQRGTTPAQRRQHALSDWLFLATLVLCMMALLAIPLLLLAYLIGRFFAMGARHA